MVSALRLNLSGVPELDALKGSVSDRNGAVVSDDVSAVEKVISHDGLAKILGLRRNHRRGRRHEYPLGPS
jgi:hypothetical protein